MPSKQKEEKYYFIIFEKKNSKLNLVFHLSVLIFLFKKRTKLIEIYLHNRLQITYKSHILALFLVPLQLTRYQQVTKTLCKRCLVRLQKGVSQTSKEHLLQVNQASFRSQKSMFKKQGYEKLQQNRLLLSFYRITIGVETPTNKKQKETISKMQKHIICVSASSTLLGNISFISL